MQCGCGPASQVEIVHIPLELGLLGFLCSLNLRLFLQGQCEFDSTKYFSATISLGQFILLFLRFSFMYFLAPLGLRSLPTGFL